MTFSEVVRRPAYLQVAEQLRDAVLDGRLAAGEELPSERELCERFGVGRTTVREALRALQTQGLVVSAGATAPLRVAAPEDVSTGPVRDALGHLLRLGRVPLSDLVDLRRALEGEAAAIAASTTPAPDLAAARVELEAMRAAGDDVVAFEEADVRFHLALVAASGNAALHLVMLAVRESISAHLLEALAALDDPRAVLRRLTREHGAILAALEGRDAAAAERLAREHVTGFYTRVLR